MAEKLKLDWSPVLLDVPARILSASPTAVQCARASSSRPSCRPRPSRAVGMCRSPPSPTTVSRRKTAGRRTFDTFDLGLGT